MAGGFFTPGTNRGRHRDMTLLSQRYDPLPPPAVSESSPPGVLQTLRTRQGGHLEGAGRVPGGDKEDGDSESSLVGLELTGDSS